MKSKRMSPKHKREQAHGSVDKMGIVMREFYAHKLHDSHGNLVTNPAQAKAIGESEKRRYSQGKGKHARRKKR